MHIDLFEIVKSKIIEKYQLNEEKAEKYAKDLIHQLIAHGGNPANDPQLDRTIDVVVRRWIENEYER